MKMHFKPILGLLLAAMMIPGLVGCAAAKDKEASPAQEEAPTQTSGAVGYLNDGYVLNIPSELSELVLVDAPTGAPDGVLFRVSEKDSVNAGAADGHDVSWGDGWLFGIRRVDADTLQEMLCYDMSGEAVFAADAENHYFLFTHPTDVRLYRQNDAYEEAMEQWTRLNDWAWNDARRDFLAENSGLEAFERGNSMLDMYLARAAYLPDADYVLSGTEYGSVAPNGIDAAPFAEQLMSGNGIVCEDADIGETPDGEYIVLNFPADDVRFDFFLAEGKENYVRMVWSGENEQLMKLTFPDDTKASEVMREWYDELVTADIMSPLGYTPDDLIGRWAEKAAGRCLIEIDKADEGVYNVAIHWSGSAFEQAIWEMTATPVGEGGMLRYENGRHYVRTYTSETEYNDVPEYEDGTGIFSLNSAFELVWEDERDDAAVDCVFVHAD